MMAETSGCEIFRRVPAVGPCCPDDITPGECECVCECEHCLDELTSCCFKITISGITEDGCGDCDDLNRAYYVFQDTEVSLCQWTRKMKLPDGCDVEIVCNVEDIVLTIESHLLTVTLGDHEWSVSFGTFDPDCCNAWTEEDPLTLTHQTTAADCDSTASTCEVVAWCRPQHPHCGEETFTCAEDWIEGPLPCCMKMTLSGVRTWDPQRSSACWHCECLNEGEYFLSYSQAICGYHDNSVTECPAITTSLGEVGEAEEIEITFSEPTPGTYRVTVRFIEAGDDVYFTKDYDAKIKVEDWVSEAIPYSSGELIACDVSGATIHLTPEYNDHPCVNTPNLGGECLLCSCLPSLGELQAIHLQLTVRGVRNGHNCDECEKLNDMIILDFTPQAFTECGWAHATDTGCLLGERWEAGLTWIRGRMRLQLWWPSRAGRDFAWYQIDLGFPRRIAGDCTEINLVDIPVTFTDWDLGSTECDGREAVMSIMSV